MRHELRILYVEIGQQCEEREERRGGYGARDKNQVTASEGSVRVSQWDDTREEGRDREVYNRLPGED